MRGESGVQRVNDCGFDRSNANSQGKALSTPTRIHMHMRGYVNTCECEQKYLLQSPADYYSLTTGLNI